MYKSHSLPPLKLAYFQPKAICVPGWLVADQPASMPHAACSPVYLATTRQKDGANASVRTRALNFVACGVFSFEGTLPWLQCAGKNSSLKTAREEKPSSSISAKNELFHLSLGDPTGQPGQLCRGSSSLPKGNSVSYPCPGCRGIASRKREAYSKGSKETFKLKSRFWEGNF